MCVNTGCIDPVCSYVRIVMCLCKQCVAHDCVDYQVESIVDVLRPHLPCFLVKYRIYTVHNSTKITSNK